VLLNGFPNNSDIYDAAHQARLEDFRRLQARIRMIWGEADAYLNVGVAEDPAIAGEALHLIQAGHWPQIEGPAEVPPDHD
jgi:pimeloyl-ACP methyl ester carboxylesterase